MILVLAGGAAGWGWWALGQWTHRPFGTKSEHAFKIPPRTSAREIARRLAGEGLVGNDMLFLAALRLKNRGRAPLQAGDYQIPTPISPEALMNILSHGRFERALTIPEGWTGVQIARRLVAEKYIKNEREWLDLVARPLPPEALGVALTSGTEGFCFPETYRFDVGVKPEEILRRMVAKFRHEWDAARPDQREERSARLTLQEVVVLASMIEREARTSRRRCLILLRFTSTASRAA